MSNNIFYNVAEACEWIGNNQGKVLAVVAQNYQHLNLAAKQFSDHLHEIQFSDHLHEIQNYPSLDPTNLSPWFFKDGAMIIWIVSHPLSNFDGIRFDAAFMYGTKFSSLVYNAVRSGSRSPQTIYPNSTQTVVPGKAKDWSQVEYKRVGGPSINKKREEKVELLTQTEEYLINKLSECQHTFALEVVADEENYEADVGYFEDRINELQTLVLAQAAARAYPDRYRLLGRSEFNET